MPEENAPKNLPTEGKDLSKNVEKGGGAPQKEEEPKPTPLRPAPKEAKEAEDIFANVKEGPAETASSQSAPEGGTTTPQEAPEKETIVETPHQGFKKVLITIVVIVVFAGILAGGGYWAYNSFLKPRALSPNLNMNIDISPQQQEVPQEPEVIDSDNDGLTDTREEELGTDPTNPDTDGDKLFDREEVDVYDTDPLNTDTDGDGYEDGSEVQAGYDPKGPGKLIEIPAE